MNNKPFIHPNCPRKLAAAFHFARNAHGEGYKIRVLEQKLGVNFKYLHKMIKLGIEPNDSTEKLRAVRKAMYLSKRKHAMKKPKQNQPETPSQQQERDLFQTPAYAVDIIAPFLHGLMIWEPAAGQGKLTERLMNPHGLNVISSDIQSGVNFLTANTDFDFDAIVTNPPYSIKRKFYERCREIGKPFALLIPTDFAGWTLGALRNGCQWIIPTRRIDYITPNGKSGKQSAAQFHSGWLTYGLNLPQQIVVVELSIEQKGNI